MFGELCLGSVTSFAKATAVETSFAEKATTVEGGLMFGAFWVKEIVFSIGGLVIAGSVFSVLCGLAAKSCVSTFGVVFAGCVGIGGVGGITGTSPGASGASGGMGGMS